MSDELRKEAEKFMAFIVKRDEPNAGKRAAADRMYEICRQWLAEHPADDDEKPNVDWLKSIGGDYDPSEWNWKFRDDHGELSVAFCQHTTEPWLAEIGEMGQPWPYDMHTRKCVRRLLKALGIKVKE